MMSFLFRLAAPILSLVVLFATADPAQATIFRRGGYAPRPYFPPNRMPGWDWQRTYPWSPYNYGRNPYNPIIVPYYPAPVPIYGSSAPIYTPPPQMTTGGDTSSGVTYSPVSVSPTATTGVVEVILPSTFGNVQFNGQPTSGVGSTRYYVSPPLAPGQTYPYNVAASWTGNVGQPVQGDRIVQVHPGQVTVVNFNQPPVIIHSSTGAPPVYGR